MSTDILAAPPQATPDPAADAAPLVARLVSQHGAQWVGLDTLETWLAGPGDRVLFFHGDALRFPEGVDVAVVLPELQRAFPCRFAIGVATRADEDTLAARFGANRWPSLLFLRDGQYVSLVAGMLDWTDYLARVAEALALPVRRTPGVGIAVVADPSAGSSCR
jgi:hydrogenase-1 operon protein HyaE